MSRKTSELFTARHFAMGTSQRGLGEHLGISRRTAQRWAQHGVPSYSLAPLATAVFPFDTALAAEVAEAAGTTLEALGLVVPVPAPAPALAASAPAPLPLPAVVVDSVVCAAAEAMDLMPREVRGGLHAAFARAQAIGLSVDEVERVLRPALPPKGTGAA